MRFCDVYLLLIFITTHRTDDNFNVTKGGIHCNTEATQIISIWIDCQDCAAFPNLLFLYFESIDLLSCSVVKPMRIQKCKCKQKLLRTRFYNTKQYYQTKFANHTTNDSRIINHEMPWSYRFLLHNCLLYIQYQGNSKMAIVTCTITISRWLPGLEIILQIKIDCFLWEASWIALSYEQCIRENLRNVNKKLKQISYLRQRTQPRNTDSWSLIYELYFVHQNQCTATAISLVPVYLRHGLMYYASHLQSSGYCLCCHIVWLNLL